MVKVIIGGDVCPVGINEKPFILGDNAALFNDLQDEFFNSDLSIVNLECPLIEQEAPIEKTGPVLGAGSKCVNGIVNSSITALNLSNNHIMDHGASGLKNTLKVCKDAGLMTFGAGKNLSEASEIVVAEIGGIRIGLLGIAEHEFSIATDNNYGANPLDMTSISNRIKRQREQFDFLIVLFHGGVENYPFPTPRQRDRCRFIIDAGANIVICQHSHCPGSYEKYADADIVYGQGNLLFDHGSRADEWNIGFLVRINLEEDLSYTLDLIPHFQENAIPGSRKMINSESELLLERVSQRSKAIARPGYVEEAWKELCNDLAYNYMDALFLPFRVLRFLNRRRFITNHVLPRAHRLRFLNLIRCETHREIIETILAN